MKKNVNYLLNMKRGIAIVLTLAMLNLPSTMIFAQPTANANLSIEQMMENTNYIITRAQFARMLNASLKLDKSTYTNFIDVKTDNPYYKDLLIAKAIGYYQGDGTGKVNPDQMITGAEIVSCINSFLGFDMNKVEIENDLNVPKWANAPVSNLIDLTMIKKDFAEKKQITVSEAEQLINALVIAQMFPNSPYALKQTSLKDDFFDYYNRKYAATATIPAGMNFAFEALESAQIVQGQISQMMSEIVNSNSLAKGSDEWKMKQVYDMYMDEAGRKASEKQLQPIIKEIMNAKSIAELEEISKNASFPLQNYLKAQPSISPDNSKKYAVSLTQGSLGLPSTQYYADIPELKPLQDSYKRLIANALKYAGETENLEARSEKMFAFEKGMAEHMLPAEKLQDVKIRNTPAKWSDINANTKNIDGFLYTNEYKTVYQSMQLFVPSMDYVKYVSEQYIDINLDIIKDIAILNVYDSVSGYIGDDYSKLTDEVNSILTGQQVQRLPKETSAENMVSKFFKPQISELYAKKYANQQMKDEITAMAEKVREKTIERVNSREWLSAETKALAVEKLKAIKMFVAYPDEPLKKTEFTVPDKSAGTLLDVYINQTNVNNKESLEALQKPVDLGPWDIFNSYTSNAAMFFNYNTMVFPAGFLQGKYIPGDEENNLGIIGSVLAHEITHSIDTTGAQYDKNGTTTNWWKEEDYKNFTELTQKVSNQLSNTEFAGKTLIGDLVVGETVSDMGAIECIIDIVKDDKNIDMKKVLESYTKYYSAKMSLEVAQLTIASDNHLPNKLRVNYVLPQTEEFYKIFGITENDPMYIAPEKRVKVW